MNRSVLVSDLVCGWMLVASSAFAVDTATIAGTIAFEGVAPKRHKIATDADPVCAAMHADEPLLSEEVIVNTNGTLRNVFVYVKKGLEGKSFDAPKTPVVIDQKGCQYHPHVFGMMAHQPLIILNSDNTLHNIHAHPVVNQEFNVGEPIQGMKVTRTFAYPEVMVPFKCDVHPWMNAYVGVLGHPFYAVTGSDGTFSLKGLPPGDYLIEAWHEKYGTQDATVSVGAGETKTVNFTFSSHAQ
ncbi:MAG TPA: carboxypeptidase regulatory-like domain-containing protein [Verrucomicrobiae bacterium]|nr:carboxypeptidase regulatory-like domain-containing protein [Verrucomicrobiae bacterium]